jgi:hypothetical protein
MNNNNKKKSIKSEFQTITTADTGLTVSSQRWLPLSTLRNSYRDYKLWHEKKTHIVLDYED